MPRKKKVDVVVEDVVIENPEEITIEDVLDEFPPLEIIEEEVKPVKNPNIIPTGVIVNGKREFKDLIKGITFIED